MSGWELDDEELATIQKNRERAFDYMVDMVQEYNLDGMQTLSEKSIEEFAKICAIESIPEKIKRLTAEEEQYKLLGNYWLELADCYFENSQYEECLQSVLNYNELSIGIYLQDTNYVKIVPKAIVAAQNVYSGDEYIECLTNYVCFYQININYKYRTNNRLYGKEIYMGLFRRVRSNCTVGTFEKKHKLPPGTFRNKNGRDTRSDKLIETIRKEGKMK